MNGCQFRGGDFRVLQNETPAIAMNVSTIATLMMTIAELKFADS